jgi:hypothetical protein
MPTWDSRLGCPAATFCVAAVVSSRAKFRTDLGKFGITMGYPLTPSPSVYWNQRISVKSQSNLSCSSTCGQNLEPQGLSLDVTILVRYTSSMEFSETRVKVG